ncbi:hypothetical protein [Streptomyces malaysiensis]|uniref:Uncharacterized protein n=1 Tax=Streptomyces malaysiensis TaxID=92644 RepID=A0A7X5X930_STRMQ|nr:hypothetical protein [Streptomyces malaysiensis]NIY68080.1 hypothetical protein [Streptomyces malaysiensis]
MDYPASGRVARRDKEGRPLGLLEWAQLFEDYNYRLVAETEVDDVLVRTLWEGHDVQVMGAGDMFHTGVRSGERWQDAWTGHHPCTVIEAEAAHELIVAKLRQAVS